MTRWLVAAALIAMPAAALAGDRVRLDTATVEQLDAIDGVSPELAEAIVKLRADRGRIASIEELRILPGVDAEALDGLRAATEIPITAAAGGGRSFSSAELRSFWSIRIHGGGSDERRSPTSAAKRSSAALRNPASAASYSRRCARSLARPRSSV